MTTQEILKSIEHDADSFRLTAADALPAFAEFSVHISEDDLTTLIGIGSVLYREAERQAVSPSPRS